MNKKLSLKKFGRSMGQLICFIFIGITSLIIFLDLVGILKFNIFSWILIWINILLWLDIYARAFLLADEE